MTSIHKPIMVITRKANGDVNPYRFVDYAGQECSLNEPAVGISLSAATNGENMPVATHGIVKVESSATIAEGAMISIASEGKAKTQFSSERTVGRALEGGANGDLIPIILITA